MIHGHTQGSFFDDQRYWPIFERARGPRRADLPPPDVAASGRDEGLFRRVSRRSRAPAGASPSTPARISCESCFAGVFDAYPKLKIILGHLGEGMPFAMHRLNDHTYRAAKRRGLKKTPLDYIRDNCRDDQRKLVRAGLPLHAAGAWAPIVSLGRSTGPTRPTRRHGVLQQVILSDGDREKIAHGNAERILRM